MKIKQYILCGLMGAVALGAPSCSNDFLDEDLTTKYTTEYFETPEGLEALTISLYGHLRWRFAYDHANAVTLLGTDEWTEGVSQDNPMWDRYDNRLSPAIQIVNGNTATAQAWWDEMYFGVASANTIIATADAITDETVRKNCLAHAYLSRGLDYYTLTVQYGAVVLQTEPAIGVVRTFERATVEECWEQVISDFRQAYNLFTGESDVFGVGKGVAWTKATAAHWLAKALLWRSSERNSSWNSAYIENDLKEAIEAATYAIGARTYETNYINLFGTWDDVDCAAEQSDEILMAAPWNKSSASAGRYGNQALHMFNSQFSKYSGGYVTRGLPTGGKDFQRCLPTEYTLTVFDHVNDSRLWKSFRTVYGANAIPKGGREDVKLGDPAIVFILNTADDHTYDGYTFGSFTQNPDFKDDAGRLPEWSRDNRQTPTSGDLTSKPGQWIPNSSVLYQEGKYVAYDFRQDGVARCNMLPGLNKTVSGAVNGDGGQNGFRDVTLARIGETYLVRAECYARQGKYPEAMADINVLRKRAAWQAGENRSYYIDGCDALVNNTEHYEKRDKKTGVEVNKERYLNTNLHMNTYYLSNPTLAVTTASTEDAMTLKSFPGNLPPEDEAVMTKLKVSSDKDRAIHFILNERTRELAGEWMRWEDLSRTGTLGLRYKAFHPDAALGNFVEGKHELRPVPQSFIDGLLHEDGTNLTDEEKAAWQNPGY